MKNVILAPKMWKITCSYNIFGHITLDLFGNPGNLSLITYVDQTTEFLKSSILISNKGVKKIWSELIFSQTQTYSTTAIKNISEHQVNCRPKED